MSATARDRAEDDGKDKLWLLPRGHGEAGDEVLICADHGSILAKRIRGGPGLDPMTGLEIARALLRLHHRQRGPRELPPIEPQRPETVARGGKPGGMGGMGGMGM